MLPLQLLFRRDRAELDVAKRDLPMIALEGEVAGAGFGKQRHRAEFAFGDPLLEVFTAQHVFEVLHAVDFVLALFGGDEQAEMVPLAGGLGCIEGFLGLGIGRRLVQGVQPPASLRIGGLRIVFELKFGACRPGRISLVGDVVHDAAVAAFGNVVVQLQFEGIELFGRDEIARVMGIDANEGAVLDLPARPNAFALEVVPAAEVLSVKQQLPTGGLLRAGERVELRCIRRVETRGRQGRENQRRQKQLFHAGDVIAGKSGGQSQYCLPPGSASRDCWWIEQSGMVSGAADSIHLEQSLQGAGRRGFAAAH
jgi:hypothetical protein